MRKREKERIQRVKDAQKRLEETRTRIQEETVNDFPGDKMITWRPLFSREVKALETLIERNQRWVTKPRKKKVAKSPTTGATTDSVLFISFQTSAKSDLHKHFHLRTAL